MNPKATLRIPSLVKRLRRGDEDAFGCLFRQFGPKIYGTARRMFLNHEDAEELVQEVFLKIWKKRAELKDDLSFQGYLITIMKSMIYKKAKRKAMFTVYQETAASGQGIVANEGEEKLEYEDLRKYSQMAIDQLPKCQKVVFEMRYLNHRSADEIAEHLSISKRTVESHIYKATKSVREKLSGSSYLSPELFLVVAFFFFELGK
ncbi:MAG: RNA polymerase sigma-70 factor [Alphaproteobacteria bacterium]|nr:RNA polymerase sigma-70 factor [Alphaproteobacteria bacterium]